jgi:EAL and modified HD-GYP domain-containing signal transduction protein
MRFTPNFSHLYTTEGTDMNVFVARQPIFNSDKKVFAYELLFRTGMSNAFPDIDGETATSSLLSSSFFTTGIDNISNGNRVFINFTEELLVRGTPTMFPEDTVVVEVLENVPPTAAVISACQDLKEKGYALALDDFVYQKNLVPLLKIAKFIKIDFRLTPVEEIATLISELKQYPCSLLAEKIETYQEFQQAKDMGFSYFQGYFFARPEIIKNKEISSSQLIMMRIICEINKTEFDVTSLETLINQDVSIIYKLLKYLNSSYFSRLQPISSIRQAIAFLGEYGIRLFVSLIVASKLAELKPNELIRTSMIRANVLFYIGEELKMQSNDLFMLGLFSLIDAMLDNNMENLVGQLPLVPDVKEALVERKGQLFPFLHLIESYETGQWECLEEEIGKINMAENKLIDFYLDAVKLADHLQAM